MKKILNNCVLYGSRTGHPEILNLALKANIVKTKLKERLKEKMECQSSSAET